MSEGIQQGLTPKLLDPLATLALTETPWEPWIRSDAILLGKLERRGLAEKRPRWPFGYVITDEGRRILRVSDENPKDENAERSRGEALPAQPRRGDALTPSLSPKEQKGEEMSSSAVERCADHTTLTLRGEMADFTPQAASIYAAWIGRTGGLSKVSPWRLSLTVPPKSGYPGGSKERVSRAGNSIRQGNPTLDDLAVIDLWRAAHRPVLNTFQAILRNRTRGTSVIVAQRHKRKRTIFGKLRRFPTMQLARMDDVAGCRLIFRSIDELYAFRERLHTANFKHRLRNDVDKYDYIKKPKKSGYRGVHDVYEYNVNSAHGKDFKGVLIELQYRTIFQHAWSTAVEVVGFITESQPKFEEGDQRYQDILLLASEVIARSFENRTGYLAEMPDDVLVQTFLRMDNDLGFMRMLRSLNSADNEITSNRNVILIFSDKDTLDVKTFRDATDALRALFELEQANPGKDIVLVRGDRSEDVREAFKNYFSDARQFIEFIDEGCQILAGDRVQRA